MSWDININSEDSDPQLDDIKRRVSTSEDWAREHILDALFNAKDMMMKAKDAKRKEMSDDAAYTGVALALAKLVDEVLPGAVKKMEDKGPAGSKLDTSVHQAKILFYTKIVKELVEKADEIRRM